MTVLERPEPKIQSAYEPQLRVERTDISFQDVPGGRVRIQITVHNASERRSRPASLALESAPLGAFVPWQPLTLLPVPALEPGESRDLTTEVPRPRPAPLGDFDRVPPKKLLTAVNSPDQPSPPSGGGSMLASSAFIQTLQGSGSSRTIVASATSLPPDLLELVGRDQPHWAGNINVFIGARSVERHLANALRVYPGRANLAMFLVGDQARPDAYAFELVGLEPDWKAVLYNGTHHQTLLVGSSDAPIPEARWVESTGSLVVILATHPPAGCQNGHLEVRVTRRSSGKTAIVEFNLDPTAQGAGCYSV